MTYAVVFASQTGNTRRVALFGTAGFGGSDAYFDQLAARFAAHLPGGCRLTGHFFCQGKMPLSVRCRYEQMQAENPGDPKVEGMLANFDAALAHPQRRRPGRGRGLCQGTGGEVKHRTLLFWILAGRRGRVSAIGRSSPFEAVSSP